MARYERAVLTALSDSETAINRYASAGRTKVERREARVLANEAVGLARLRFDAGEDDLTSLLQARTAFSLADRLSVQSRSLELQQMAALNKALGGGWEAVGAVGGN